MGRSPQPVEIYYYPKKATGRASRRLQTVETVVTNIVDAPDAVGRVTLTDESAVDDAAIGDLTRLGYTAFQAGRVDEARTVFESLVTAGRADAFVHSMLGTIMLGAHELDGALKQFEAALAIDPDELPALVYRAEIRLTKRRTARAVADLERAITLGTASDPFVARAKKLLRLARANRTA